MATKKLENIFAGSILQNMSDGVLVLTADGLVAATNQPAIDIMGPEVAEPDFRLAGLALTDSRNDLFMQILIDSLYEGVTINNRVVPFVRTDETELAVSVTASHLRDDKGTLEGVFIVMADVTEVEKLRESSEDLNQQLQQALHVTDEKAKELETALDRGQKIRNRLTGAVLLFFICIGAYYWISSSAVNDTPGYGFDATDSEKSFETKKIYPNDGSMTVTVDARPLTQSISLSGIVAPLEELSIAAPFQSQVTRKLFYYGDHVERGQTLLVLDTANMEAKVRDAKAKFIRAKMKFLELQQWNKTPDVSRARRELSQARSQLTKAESKLAEDKTLLDEGIIPRSEYESSAQSLRDKKMQYISSQENLKSIIGKGNAEYLSIAQMELENAEASMLATEAKAAKGVIIAPASGIAIRPGHSSGDDTKPVTTGMIVNEGQLLLSIGSTEGLSITTEVDELDINYLETGQRVLISGDAFPDIQLEGRIAQLSSQANNREVPTFTATIRLRDLPEGVENHVRLGMTTNMQVETYSDSDALMIPLSAVIHANGISTVFVVTDDGSVEPRQIETGYTTLSEVEIRSGLERGTVIMANPKQ